MKLKDAAPFGCLLVIVGLILWLYACSPESGTLVR